MTEGLGDKWQWVGNKLKSFRAVQPPRAALWSRKRLGSPEAAHIPWRCRAASTWWNCPGTANKQSHPGLSKGTQSHKLSNRAVILTGSFPSQPEGIPLGPREGLQLPSPALPSLPCLLVSKPLEPLTPTYQPSFLTSWQEQGFACTKLWHSKLLKPSSLGWHMHQLGTWD